MSRIVLSVAVAWFGAGLAAADLIVAYRSQESYDPLPAALTHVDVVGAPLTRGPGLTPDAGRTFSATGWTGDGDAATAVAAGDLFTWGFASTSAYDLTDLAIRYDRTFSGPEALAIDLSVNGGEFERVFTDNAVDALGETQSGIDLSRFTGVTSATFRLAGWDAIMESGLFEIENDFSIDGASYGIVVNGTAADPAAVPEPGTTLLLSLAGAGELVTPEANRVAPRPPPPQRRPLNR